MDLAQEFDDVTVTINKRCKACNGRGVAKKHHACAKCMGKGRLSVEIDWGTFVNAVALTTNQRRATI